MVRSARLLVLFLLALAAFAMPSASEAQVAVGVSIRIGPPALPVYPQPICPGPPHDSPKRLCRQRCGKIAADCSLAFH